MYTPSQAADISTGIRLSFDFSPRTHWIRFTGCFCQIWLFNERLAIIACLSHVHFRVIDKVGTVVIQEFRGVFLSQWITRNQTSYVPELTSAGPTMCEIQDLTKFHRDPGLNQDLKPEHEENTGLNTLKSRTNLGLKSSIYPAINGGNFPALLTKVTKLQSYSFSSWSNNCNLRQEHLPLTDCTY